MDTLIIINSILSPIVIGAVAVFAFKAQKEAYKQALESAEEKYRRRNDNLLKATQDLRQEMFLLCGAEPRYTSDEIDSCKRKWIRVYEEEKQRSDLFSMLKNFQDEKG